MPTTGPSNALLRGIALATIFGIIGLHSRAQTKEPMEHRTADLFSMQVTGSGKNRSINLDPDSTTGHPALDSQCAALYWHHVYLFENYAKTAAYVWKLQPLLPDTALIRAKLDSSFTADTAFTALYNKAITKEPVADLQIDSALNIAAHFYYLHSDNGMPVVHVCVGINKVKELSEAPAHPFHAAFCYQTIWQLKNHFALLKKVKAPYSKEFKKKPPTEARILEVEQMVYAGMASRPELRRALITTYERTKDHLNFRLVY
jgi:hypothetical protein